MALPFLISGLFFGQYCVLLIIAIILILLFFIVTNHPNVMMFVGADMQFACCTSVNTSKLGESGWQMVRKGVNLRSTTLFLRLSRQPGNYSSTILL